MIRLQNIVKVFGSLNAVNNISFEVSEAETVALLGTSGCGKTTTLRMINRLIEPTSGSIYVAGKNIVELIPEQLRRSIGYVIQHHGLFPHYTIGENIGMVPSLLKWPKEKITKRIEALLEQLHLPPDCVSLYPQQLSGGQQQRVGLARALAADPSILLMDEPFGALDAITREKVSQDFKNLEALKNKTIIMVTHDVSEAFTLAKRILLMDKGRIVQEGSAVDLLFHPENDFVKEFFSAQRMQLELQALLLQDVWTLLSQENKMQDVLETDNTVSLWNALELLNAQKKEGLLIRNRITAEVRYATYQQLFSAPATLKQVSYE
jgi:osmoprotectant transport system ATP-binding protein